MPKTRSKKSGRGLATIAVRSALGLAAACAIFEFALQVIEKTPLWRVLPQPTVSLFGPDWHTGYRHRAGKHGVYPWENRAYISINSLGFRDRERPLAKADGVSRVLVLGDSLIEALQVDLKDTAVFQAEKILSSRKVEVVNLGLSGAAPPVQVARLRGHGMAFKPDAAIFVTYIGHFFRAEVQNDREWPGYREQGDGSFALSYRFRNESGYRWRTSWKGDVLYWVFDHSAVVRVLNDRKNTGVFAELLNRTSAFGDDPGPEKAACASSRLEQSLRLWRDGTPHRTRAIVEAFLKDLNETSRAHNLPVILALRGIGEPCAATAVMRAELVKSIGELLSKYGLRFVDVDWHASELLGFKQNELARLHGFGHGVGGGHLNERGHLIYAQILAAAAGEHFESLARRQPD